MTLVFQVGWGALFATLFGFSHATLRLSTLVLSLAGSIALYFLCRELGVNRERALAGALTLWFNPIVFSLSYTFMTDVPFLALFLFAVLFYVRGVQRGSGRDLVIGSCFAAAAFLVRHQGLLVPLAVLGYGLLARWPIRLWLRRAPQISIVPVVALVGYLLWSQSQGLPEVQAEHLEIVSQETLRLWQPALQLSGYVLLYLGLFWAPLAVGFIGAARRAIVHEWQLDPRVGLMLLGWGAAVAGLVLFFALQGAERPYMAGGLAIYTHGGWMPYLKDGSMLNVAGIGPNDLRGDRALFSTTPTRVALTLLSAGSLALLGVFLALRTRVVNGKKTPPPAILLLMLIGLAQFAGILLVSVRLFVFSPDWLSFDRYLLPLVPLTIAIGLWATQGLRLSQLLTAVALLGFALFSLVGTQDWLSFNRVRWELGQGLLAQGVSLEQIDGGMEWDAWFHYEFSQANPVPPRTPDGPFWTSLAAPVVDSTYVVSFSPQEGYRMIERREYPSWLHRDPVHLYVLEREPPP
jgi:hypothetical protein